MSKSDHNNRSNQLNPNNPAFWSSRESSASQPTSSSSSQIRTSSDRSPEALAHPEPRTADTRGNGE